MGGAPGNACVSCFHYFLECSVFSEMYRYCRVDKVFFEHGMKEHYYVTQTIDNDLSAVCIAYTIFYLGQRRIRI